MFAINIRIVKLKWNQNFNNSSSVNTSVQPGKLIAAMSKAEKRHFRISASLSGNSNEKLYVQLFDYYDKNKDHSVAAVLEKLPSIKKSQLSNVKAHLTHRILYSMRIFHSEHLGDIEARQYLDFAKVLSQKGMKTEALKMLKNARKIAEANEYAPLLYHIIDEERKLEAEKAEIRIHDWHTSLNEKTSRLIEEVSLRDKLANLALRLQSIYHQNGYVKSDEENESIKLILRSYLPSVSYEHLGDYEKIYYCQALVWYHYILQDFAGCFKYAWRWVKVFENNPALLEFDQLFYIKALNSALNALYMANKVEKYLEVFEKLIEFENTYLEKASREVTSILEEFKTIHQLNSIFITGNYYKGVKRIQEIEHLVSINPFGWGRNKILTMQYKLACVYFGADNHSRALDYLNSIINAPEDGTLMDIRSFARILALICHFEMKNEILVGYQIKSIYRYLTKMQNLQNVQKQILSFVRRTPGMNRTGLMKEFAALRSTLIEYKSNKYERRPFLYLDIIAWLDSKLRHKRIQDVIRERQNER